MCGKFTTMDWSHSLVLQWSLLHFPLWTVPVWSSGWPLCPAPLLHSPTCCGSCDEPLCCGVQPGSLEPGMGFPPDICSVHPIWNGTRVGTPQCTARNNETEICASREGWWFLCIVLDNTRFIFSIWILHLF